MDLKTVLIAIVSALGFGLWPVMGKYSGAAGAWFITVVSVGTLAVVGALSMKELLRVDAPEFRAVVLLLIAGALNGLSCYLYSTRIEYLSPTKTAAFVALVVGIAMFAPIFNFF